MGVWSFCQEVEKKFWSHFSPASWDGPALELIRNLPHRIEYMSGAREVLAIETIDSVVIDVAPFELEQATIAH